tara:strand:+ start:2574 stop:3035 length:462 start_codon:yes stop_codon:yes gene_type:complete
MQKFLGIVVLGLLISGNTNAEIVFRVKCENPKGITYSESVAHLQNDKKLGGSFEKDQFTGSDQIELIYDNSKPNEIQFIWGTDNRIEKLYAKNDKFFHWGLFDENFGNGFYWGHWSFSLPNKTLTHNKGNTHSTGISTGISNAIFTSKCEIIG